MYDNKIHISISSTRSIQQTDRSSEINLTKYVRVMLLKRISFAFNIHSFIYLLAAICTYYTLADMYHSGSNNKSHKHTHPSLSLSPPCAWQYYSSISFCAMLYDPTVVTQHEYKVRSCDGVSSVVGGCLCQFVLWGCFFFFSIPHLLRRLENDGFMNEYCAVYAHTIYKKKISRVLL